MRAISTALTAVVLAGVTVLAQGPDRVRRVRNPHRSQYIVVLRPGNDSLSVGLETAALRRGRLKHAYAKALNGFSITLPDAAAQALARDPRVLYVEEDGTMTASAGVQASPPWGLDRIDQRALPLDTQYGYQGDGGGVQVHVLDTGIRLSHTDFEGRAFLGGDYVDDDGYPSTDPANDDADPNTPDGADCHGHGTHVAGTIGGATYGVAKRVTLWSHRVMNCQGSGATSGIIAAIDAVAAASGGPAVVNMSLGGSASLALDDAVRGAIASGIVYVLAAGNSNVDASTMSPARVTEAITVGATGSSDVRASFSNYGPVVDLFAPGVSIRSTSYASDIASATMSGTSMSAPHVAGAAALYLEKYPAASPAGVRDGIVSAATSGVITAAGPGSPNLLLHSIVIPATPPSVAVTAPNGGERLYTGTPYTIEWAADDPDGLAFFDVEASVDKGVTFSAVPGCTGLPGSVRACTWGAPGPVASYATIRVIARDSDGYVGVDRSNATFGILSGTGTLTVSSPNTVVNWGRGSTQQIKWTHNLGTSSYVRIEASRDAGATYEMVAASVKNTGVFHWTTTGPNSSSAMIRVSWTNGPVSDASNTTFTIADPYLALSAPTVKANWGYGTRQRTTWTTNLGPLDRVSVLLSTDGGQTFPTSLAIGIVATKKSADILTPTVGEPTASARVRLLWTNPPAGEAATGTNPANFRIETPFVVVTTPNGGGVWSVGTPTTIKWTSNLGSLEQVVVDLSADGGSSYPWVVLAQTASDGTQVVSANSAWVSASARLRLTWVKDMLVTDASNATFRIE